MNYEEKMNDNFKKREELLDLMESNLKIREKIFNVEVKDSFFKRIFNFLNKKQKEENKINI
jgi:hypothetical protein